MTLQDIEDAAHRELADYGSTERAAFIMGARWLICRLRENAMPYKAAREINELYMENHNTRKR